MNPDDLLAHLPDTRPGGSLGRTKYLEGHGKHTKLVTHQIVKFEGKTDLCGRGMSNRRLPVVQSGVRNMYSPPAGLYPGARSDMASLCYPLASSYRKLPTPRTASAGGNWIGERSAIRATAHEVVNARMARELLDGVRHAVVRGVHRAATVRSTALRAQCMHSRQRSRERPLAAGARGACSDRLGNLGEVQTHCQTDRGAKLGGREGGDFVARGVVQPVHGSRFCGCEKGGRHRSEDILARRV